MQRQDCLANAVKVASSPTEESEMGQFYILRDQLWWACREWLAEQTLTEQEGAHILGITKNTLAGIKRRNGISFRRVTNTKVLYHVDDIVEYLQHRKVNAEFISE